MATTIVTDQNDFEKVVREWLTASGVPADAPLELQFADEEVTLRPQSAQHQELRQWLMGAMRRYDNLLKQLSDA